MQRNSRKPPLTTPRGTSYRRKCATQPCERPRPGKPGVIDQRLIQGAKDAQGFVQHRPDDVERRFAEPESTYADGMELDAFGESIL